jgi:ligand-binding SRPBCC domain-containing protein
MKDLRIVTSDVKGHFKEVYALFDKKLFEYLLPLFPPAKVIKFEGSKQGNVVELALAGQKWISLITEDHIEEKRAYFVDEGKKLPFPLKKWKHKHLVEYQDEHTCRIIDEISYSAGHPWLDSVLYPLLYFQFKQRIPAYRNYFSKLKAKQI